MTLNEYQARCADTANYADAGLGTETAINYTVLGLAGEAGEVADKWKKVLRGDHGKEGLTPAVRDSLKAELGDNLWYIARCAHELGFTLHEVADANIAKLASRKERGAIKGSGDNR